MSEVAKNLAQVRERIRAACARAGRREDEVTLIAVSKLQPDTLIREAWAAGQRDFGENYAQELRDKAQALGDLRELRWHAIGPLQTNKAKYVAQAATSFHALDRLDIARELSRRRQAPLSCYLEVNLAAETTKGGVSPAEAPQLLEAVRGLPHLEVVGLMALPPQADDAEDARAWFKKLAALGRSLSLPELSMGTTADFEVAIEEGATQVRVGTAIFGERPR